MELFTKPAFVLIQGDKYGTPREDGSYCSVVIVNLILSLTIAPSRGALQYRKLQVQYFLVNPGFYLSISVFKIWFLLIDEITMPLFLTDI